MATVLVTGANRGLAYCQQLQARGEQVIAVCRQPSAELEALKKELWGLTGDVNFKRAGNMGDVLDAALDFIQRNFKSDTPFAQ